MISAVCGVEMGFDGFALVYKVICSLYFFVLFMSKAKYENKYLLRSLHLEMIKFY